MASPSSSSSSVSAPADSKANNEAMNIAEEGAPVKKAKVEIEFKSYKDIFARMDLLPHGCVFIRTIARLFLPPKKFEVETWNERQIHYLSFEFDRLTFIMILHHANQCQYLIVKCVDYCEDAYFGKRVSTVAAELPDIITDRIIRAKASDKMYNELARSANAVVCPRYGGFADGRFYLSRSGFSINIGTSFISFIDELSCEFLPDNGGKSVRLSHREVMDELKKLYKL